MDIAQIPIVDFLKLCKDGARRKGYKWIVTIICREADSKGFYEMIKREWRSLDSITGHSMLVLLAGNESGDNSELIDKDYDYIRRYNDFATVIGGEESEVRTDLSSVRYELLEEFLPKVEKNQTDAVDSLREYFGLKERDIPCIVYTPLYEGKIPVSNIIVKIPKGKTDIYTYFKDLFDEISPKIEELIVLEKDISSKTAQAYESLLECARQSGMYEEIVDCAKRKVYLICQQPLRGMLQRYIDCCKNYKKMYGIDYEIEHKQKVELITTINEAIENQRISEDKEGESQINAFISIGNKNKIINSDINVNIMPYTQTNCINRRDK